ncbi:MAG: transporter substrate-binding domain-containing protein [Desulfobacteraceae bacterium]|nr:transporter substrate-binding domain-containing protein [Desulfobacteraceae bacterium]
MSKQFVIIVIVCVFFGLGARYAHGKDQIIWPYTCYYPLWVCEGDTVTGGIGWEIQSLLKFQMPEYEHKSVQLPVKKMLEQVKKGSNYLVYGLYKTSDREQYMYYSLPCRISNPTMVVVRKNELEKFGGKNSVSLKKLLENKKFRFLMLSSVSFGTELDPLLKEYQHNENVFIEYRTDNLDKYALKLLLNKRVDYILSTDGTLYEANQTGTADKIAMIHIKEKNEYSIGYITSPKNEWGKHIIEKINHILRREIPTRKFFKFFEPLVTREMLPELRKQYEKNIIEPVKKQKTP